jgi:HEAT repeat protein
MEYPPTLEKSARLFAELQKLDSAGNPQTLRIRYEIIHDLAEAGFREAKDYFLEGLENPDADYRWACISALVTHWQEREPELILKLEAIAESDPDEQVRWIALDSLGILRVEEALPLLKKIVLERGGESDYIVSGAYGSILRIMGHPPNEVHQLRESLDTRQIDTALLESIPDS